MATEVENHSLRLSWKLNEIEEDGQHLKRSVNLLLSITTFNFGLASPDVFRYCLIYCNLVFHTCTDPCD